MADFVVTDTTTGASLMNGSTVTITSGGLFNNIYVGSYNTNTATLINNFTINANGISIDAIDGGRLQIENSDLQIEIPLSRIKKIVYNKRGSKSE